MPSTLNDKPFKLSCGVILFNAKHTENGAMDHCLQISSRFRGRDQGRMLKWTSQNIFVSDLNGLSQLVSNKGQGLSLSSQLSEPKTKKIQLKADCINILKNILINIFHLSSNHFYF